MSDASHYQANLRGEGPSIHEGDPKKGYYRTRKYKGGPWLPVAIWVDKTSGVMVCRVGNEMASVADTWLHCARSVVPKIDALYAFEHGRWPGDAPPPIGDNNPPSDDPHENLTREAEAEAVRVRAWVMEPNEGQVAADMAANWLTNLRALETRTIAEFDAEKEPSLTEGRRVDGKWRGLKALTAEIKRLMADRYDAIARKEKARLQAIVNARVREAAEKQRAEQEAQRARMEAIAAEQGMHLEPEAEAPPSVVVVAPEVKVAFGGAQGSRIAPRRVPPTVMVHDWARAAMHYCGNPKVREQIQKLAAADAKRGVPVPGVTFVESDA